MASHRPQPSRSNPDREASWPTLEAVGLACLRGDRMLFEGFSFRLGPGELLQIEGANGSGKTSLLRILCLLILPEAGEVRWNGANAEAVRPEYLHQMAYIGHARGIKGDLSPRENLQVAAALAGGRDARIEEALDQLGLGPYQDTPVRALSAGQARRAALARLPIQGGQLWLLDEPLTGLDREGKQRVEALLESHCRAGGMVVLSTHQPMDILEAEAVSRVHLSPATLAAEEGTGRP